MTKAAYLAIADALAEHYVQLAPGTLVDSEHQLAERFGINRLTAREALRELERRLVVRREAGRGTFTAFRLEYRVELGGVPSFRRTVESLGHRIDNLSTDVERRCDELVVRRVSAIDGFVATAGEDRFPRDVGDRIADLVADGSSIHLALEQLGYTPRRRSVQLSMAVPPAGIADRLGFTGSAPPTWHLRSLTVDVGSDTVIDRSDGWMRTDMFDLHVVLTDGA